MTFTDSHVRPVIFGEVLFDCFPDGKKVLGGAPFNVAWHLQAFGANPLFISRVGDDEFGRSISDSMKTWGMDPGGIQVDPNHPTGLVNISFEGNEHSFNIVDQSAYDFIIDTKLPELGDEFLLYHGSLALRHDISRQALKKIRHQNKNNIFIDINLRSPWWSKNSITSLLSHATWMKLNEDELEILAPAAASREEQIEHLSKNYPAKIFFITLGSEGAIAIDRAGNKEIIKPSQNHEVVDTIGAGDAFSSVLLLGILRKWPLSVILERAQLFASAVTGIQGATSTELDFYEPFISAWQH
jgi:fructokinase